MEITAEDALESKFASRVWFPFLQKNLGSVLDCSKLEIEENTIFQMMIHTVIDARFFDYWVLSPFWH